MSIYKLNYRPYAGNVTPLWMRIVVLARYGLAEAWSSKFTIGLLVFSLLPPIVFLLIIYLTNNPLARALIGAGGSKALAIDASFFAIILQVQCWLALALASWVAPRLITFDLADNVLPILLSHPVTRFGYVLGKFVALMSVLSLVTWIPALLLFVYEGYTSPVPWFASNLQIGIGLLAGAMIWITFLSILGLALSSWVKWRVVATGIIFAAVFVPAGVGAIVSGVLRTKWGLLLNLPVMMSLLWRRILGAPDVIRQDFNLPTNSIIVMLVLGCLLFVAMLNARIRAREVVKG